MKPNYRDDLDELISWVTNTNQMLAISSSLVFAQQQVQRICQLIQTVSYGIMDEYPYYSKILSSVSPILFRFTPYNSIELNLAVFGELYVVVHHIKEEPVNMQFWGVIHPRISDIAKELFRDGHFGNAAEVSLKELETRLREKYMEVKNCQTSPAKVIDIIGALFSDNGSFRFCDVTTQSGKDYRKGIYNLFEGVMSAYRNPSAHANISRSKHESMEQIFLASQLMYILDIANNGQ